MRTQTIEIRCTEREENNIARMTNGPKSFIGILRECEWS